ncbi:MAG: Crp/Fnr family transcriptional regulator [Lachnospiraceae bacterium]|nr:Crp/Fnr family transcriptional regulator [Lachnospiraceae bacterium]
MNSSFLANTMLFHGIREDEISALLPCLFAREKKYKKDALILRAGDVTAELGIVAEGSVNIIVNHYWGGSNIFGHVAKGDLFAENFAAIPGKELICDVVAAENCTVLFLNLERLLTTCEKGCVYHNRIIKNLIRIAATKNFHLSTRMMHIASKSIRERLLSYLSAEAMENGTAHFTIPFNRQQLADYLGVDRSALSNELGKMQREGLITFHKNDFTLLQAE